MTVLSLVFQEKAYLCCHNQGYKDILLTTKTLDYEIETHNTVTQQVYACFSVEVLSIWFTAIVFMIAETSIDRSLQTVELFSHVLFKQRTNTDVYDVAADKYKVWMPNSSPIMSIARCRLMCPSTDIIM